MGYREGGYKGNSTWVGVVVAVLLLGRCVLMPLSTIGGQPPLTAATIENTLLDDPKTGQLFATIKRTYPEEFNGLTRDMLQRSKAGASPSEVEEAMLTYLIDAGRRHRKEIVQAPHAAFEAYRQAEIKVAATLRTADVNLCDQYISKGSFRTTTPAVDQKVLIDFRTTTWETTAAGRDNPVKRAIKQPSDQTGRTIAASMIAYGLKQSQVAAFFDENQSAMARLSSVERCELGIAFLKAVDGLPGEKADQFYAFLASRSG
jgi:hypothetical protein